MMSRKVDNRKKYQTLLAVGKRELGWDEDTYRMFLADQGATLKDDKYSALTMSIGQLALALEAMKQKGFKPKSSKATPWRLRRINKITALWCALADAQIVRDRSESAMVKWSYRITKKNKLEWSDETDLNNCIEALKKWAAREGVAIDE